jgi:hypothetical protein
MYTTYPGKYSLEYYNSLTALSFKIKAVIRLFKIKRTAKSKYALG